MTEADAGLAFPALKPAEEVLQTAENNAIQPDIPETLQDRVDALNSRAATLRATGLDADTRERLETVIDTATPDETPAKLPQVQP